MSAPDMELLMSLYDVLKLREGDLLAYAVNKGLVGEKGGH